MKEQSSIPTGKVERAGAFVKTGIKIGGNYLKHMVRKTMDSSVTKEDLHQENAEDIYDSLSQLKGSALKVAQMMSMDRNLLPKAYTERFQMSQYSAPPLSAPLVIQTFKKAFGKAPDQIFDSFDLKAANAASIGQVHKAVFNGKPVAVKVQYPGVAHSIASDLKMVKPFAVRLMGLNQADVDRYTEEVEKKLLEETDYYLEVKNGQDIAKACSQLANLRFPHYYNQASSDRIITMDWMEGLHMKEFLNTNPSQQVRDSIGQALWDFYELQIHTLKAVHADPHPGNFLFKQDGTVGIIDFGCVKAIPQNFYEAYFGLINLQNLNNPIITRELFLELEFIYETDQPQTQKFYTSLFREMCILLAEPFKTEFFDFSQTAYFEQIYAFGEKLSKMKELKESKVARGAKDSLYINRTYYGLYSILHELKANVRTHSPFKILEAVE